MIYLAMITSRVPVIPPFTSEIGGDRVPLPFSEIFDLPYLRQKLRIPILEWSDIKDTALAANTDAPHDELGCWNLWQVQSIVADGPRASFSTDTLGLGTVALELSNCRKGLLTHTLRYFVYPWTGVGQTDTRLRTRHAFDVLVCRTHRFPRDAQRDLGEPWCPSHTAYALWKVSPT